MSEPYQHIVAAIHYLQHHYHQRPSLEEVARQTGLSPYYLQKLFTKYTGVSPKRFCQFLINNEAKQHLLKTNKSLLEASHSMGFSNPSRLHDLMVSIDAVTPGQYRQRGRQLSITYGVYNTPFGPSLLATTARGICGLEFIVDSSQQAVQRLKNHWPEATISCDQDANIHIIEIIFHSRPTDYPLNLDLKGTNFQLKVWQALLSIPEGSLASYSSVAERIGKKNASRAVGNAVGQNPVAYLIPCHRVLRRDGSIGGYRWGQERKLMMLSQELISDHTD